MHKTLVIPNPAYHNAAWALRTAEWLNSLGDDASPFSHRIVCQNIDIRLQYLTENPALVIRQTTHESDKLKITKGRCTKILLGQRKHRDASTVH